MNENYDPGGVSPRRQPLVYVVTLGVFEVYVNQQMAVWRGGGAGRGQLQRAFAYLVAHRNTLVRTDVLSEVAGVRSRQTARHVIRGIRTLLHTWGIGNALQEQDAALALRPHATWQTDTDRLEALYHQAEQLDDDQQVMHALQVLQAAEPLCGGDYLPTLDLLPDYMPYGEHAYWNTVQKRVLRRLIQVSLTVPDTWQHEQSLRVAGRLIALDRYDLESYTLAVRAARHCHNEGAARRFLQMAQDIRDELGPD